MSNTELATIKENSLEVNHMKLSRLDDSLFSKELAPHYMQLAGKLASSELVPKSFRGKPQDLFICWAMGYQVGLSPEQSMQCIAVINGKPSMWGDEMLALCMAHKDFDDIEEVPMKNKDGTVIGFSCTVKRRGKSPKVNEFTLDMAKKAGLLGKIGPWTQYPERMLKVRARGFSLRDAFPDALKGIKLREEVQDYIEAEYKVVDDKVSRTEFLKQDLINRGNHVEIPAETTDRTVPMEDKLDPEEGNLRFNSVEEASAPQEESVVLESDNNLYDIRPAQLQTIKRLLEEKAFTEERITKALIYYEVDSLESMTCDLADHFIDQLNKA